MTSTPEQKTLRSRTAYLVAATMLLACTAQAQLSVKRQKYDSIANKYKNEHAVYTDIKERLVISDEDGELSANSYSSVEKLFISDLSLNTYNTDYFSYSSLYPLSDYDGISWVPEKDDYKKLENCRFGEGGNGYQTFFDDQREVQAFYTRLKKKSITRTTHSNYYPDLHMLDGFVFAENLPIANISYEVTTPDYVKMGFAVKGIDTNVIKRTVEEKNGKRIYRFTAANLPALRSFAGVPRMTYYAPHIIPYVISFRLTGAKKDSVLGGSKDALYKYDYHFIKGLNLKTDTFLNNKVAELTRNAYSEREKAARIYAWVQSNMHYIAFENGLEGFIPRPADTVFKRKYGDCKDMASVLEAMCRRAGLKAYFVSIGTNRIPYNHDELQLTCLYDHMICAVNINDEWIFLDGTDKYLPFGANREDLQGKEALIAIDKDHYKIVKIPEMPASGNTITDNMTMSIAYNDVNGTVSQHYTGYNAWDIHHYLDAYDKKEEKDKFARKLAGRGAYNFVMPSYSLDAASGGDMDVDLRGSYSIPGYAQQAGKQYFINMNMKQTLPAPRINDTGRYVPYYLESKGIIRESVTLDIPKGYKVTYLPKEVQGGREGLWSYKISYKADEKAGKITLNKEYTLNTMTIAPKQFDEHNKMVDDLRKLYKETVVLTAKK